MARPAGKLATAGERGATTRQDRSLALPLVLETRGGPHLSGRKTSGQRLARRPGDGPSRAGLAATVDAEKRPLRHRPGRRQCTPQLPGWPAGRQPGEPPPLPGGGGLSARRGGSIPRHLPGDRTADGKAAGGAGPLGTGNPLPCRRAGFQLTEPMAELAQPEGYEGGGGTAPRGKGDRLSGSHGQDRHHNRLETG